MKLKLLLAAAAAFAAFPAQAQDDVVADFTGPRIEGHVGWDRVGIQNRDIRQFGGRGDFGPSDQDNGFIGGGEIGFDVQLSGIVVGAYVGADFSETEERIETDFVHLRADRNLYAGARAGVALGGALLYAKGGLSRGNLDVEFLNGAPAAIQTAFNNDDIEERDGWHFGGGVEMNMGSMFYGRIDYMHTRYERIDLGSLGRTGTTVPSYEQRFTRNQVTAGVGLRF